MKESEIKVEELSKKIQDCKGQETKEDSKGAKVNIDGIKLEADTDARLEDCMSELSLEGTEQVSNDGEKQEVAGVTVLNSNTIQMSGEIATCFTKVSDDSSKEMNDSGSDNASISSEVELVSYAVEVEKYHNFSKEDGIMYMLVSDSSMTRQYILREEDEDENWFPKKKVYDEILTFVNRQHQILGRKNCAQRRLNLNRIIEGLKKGMADEVINDKFLNYAFMHFYETIEGVA